MVSARSSNQKLYAVLVYYPPVHRGIPIDGSSEVFFQRLVKSKGCPRRSGPADRFVEFLVTIDAEITTSPTCFPELEVMQRELIILIMLREPRRALHARIAIALKTSLWTSPRVSQSCWRITGPRPGEGRKNIVRHAACL
jgi:hypothetical protein